MFNQEMTVILRGAKRTATKIGNINTSLEHILYSALFSEKVKSIFDKVENSWDKTLYMLENDMIMKERGFSIDKNPEYSLDALHVLSVAKGYASQQNREACVNDFFKALFKSKSGARTYLEAQGFTQSDFVDDNTVNEAGFTKIEGCENLTEKAANGKISKVIGRQEEIKSILHILSRFKKNNPILVGEAGVGKTVIAESIADAIIKNKVPKTLKDAEMFSLDIGYLLAGTSFRGQFEEKVKNVIEDLKKHKNAILFIDEIHGLVNAGSTTSGSIDASNMFKPALANGLKCIGATTYKEYKDIIEKKKAFARRFQKVEVLEPDSSDTFNILRGVRHDYEKHHEVKFSDNMLKHIVYLSDKYINTKFMPDKALDVMDEVGSYVRLEVKKKLVQSKDIEKIVAKTARVPVQSMSASDSEKLKSLEFRVKENIFGQDDAVNSVISSIKLARAGLGADNKPIGSFLFSGPTGVGKTELAKQLADGMGLSLMRFDMSEYMEKHSVSKFIGAPPGYVGFDQGGELVEAVIKNPNSIILLDEIEKAHPDIYNILLQVMDYATLTDNSGRKADFRSCVLIMTTNAGAVDIVTNSVGFGAKPKSVSGKETIEKTFAPEFRNRLDAWVPFNSLDRDTIKMVAKKCLAILDKQLSNKNISLSYDNLALNWLAENGYDEKNGARPMDRLIDIKIRKEIADEILFGDLRQGGSIKLSSDKDLLTIKCARKGGKIRRLNDKKEFSRA